MGLALALALSIVVIPSTGSAQAPLLPTSGALFGAYVQPGSHTGPDRRSALTSFETLVGRKMAIERVYYFWDQAWPTADDAWTRDAGRIPYISWNAQRTDGTTATWSDIAAGVYDPVILARASDLIAFGGPVDLLVPARAGERPRRRHPRGFHRRVPARPFGLPDRRRHQRDLRLDDDGVELPHGRRRAVSTRETTWST